MFKKEGSISRRKFIKAASSASFGSLLLPFSAVADSKSRSETIKSAPKVVPTRPFGRTGVDIPILGLGLAFGNLGTVVLKQAQKMGVSMWDTAASYLGGNSERAIGKYFARYPEDRKRVFLVTKAHSLSAENWSKDLDESLKRMNTSYIDLFLSHAVTFADSLAPPAENSDLWAKSKKSEGKIKFFGFSTHSNVEDNLMQASKYGWIDGIMFSYNFRVMQSEKMKKAIDACTKSGIGLIAMKTQASGHSMYYKKITPDENEQELFDSLVKKGLTLEQAKLKVVWADKRIASITSAINNMTILKANVAAAVNDTEISMRENQLLKQYANRTASDYCAGCASICEPEMNNEVPIRDVIRFIMYARCYKEHEKAISLFNEIPLTTRKRIAYLDYRKAERKCPQKIEIGQLMRKATTELV